MNRRYSEEELEKAYQKLPDELQGAVVSLETSEAVSRICERYDVLDERFGQIGRYVSYVLMGLVLPSEFQGILEKEVKIPKNTAKEIARDINRFVFYPVKPALEQLHSMEVGKASSKETETAVAAPEESLPERPEEKKGPDTYREPLE